MKKDEKLKEFEENGRISNMLSNLIELFIKGDTTADIRKQILEKIEHHYSHLANSLFLVVGWHYDFEKDGNPYVLQYTSTDQMRVYELNLYRGPVDNEKLIKNDVEVEKLIKSERSRDKCELFMKFLKSIDAIKNGEFDI